MNKTAPFVSVSLLWLVLTAFVLPEKTWAQSNSTPGELTFSLQPANLKHIPDLFDDVVSCDLPGIKGHFQKSAAKTHFEQFLISYPADSVRVVKQGSTGQNNGYVIGDYFSQGSTFYLYLMWRRASNKDIIFQMNANKK